MPHRYLNLNKTGERFTEMECQLPEAVFCQLAVIMLYRRPVELEGRMAVISRCRVSSAAPMPGYVACTLAGQYVMQEAPSTEELTRVSRFFAALPDGMSKLFRVLKTSKKPGENGDAFKLHSIF